MSHKANYYEIFIMVIKEIINIKDDRLTMGLEPIVRIMSKINNSETEDIVFDCSYIRFTSPVFIISLMLYLSSCNKRVSVINTNTYLNKIYFYNALKPDHISEKKFGSILENYLEKTYIPVISFPAFANRATDKDAILTAIENLLHKQLNIECNVLNGLKYILGEMVDNITEHSKSERGLIFTQAYPKKGYIDLCIADQGITLKGSFNSAGIEISNDIEAMQAANKGISSKNLPDAENRGYGIYTSKKMLISGLEGQYMMISGNALYLKDNTIDKIVELPSGLKWNGTVIALRLPYRKKKFSYINYVE